MLRSVCHSYLLSFNMAYTLPYSNPMILFRHRIIPQHHPLARLSQHRWESIKRVQDRSKKKRINDLEIVVQKHKVTSKILNLLEVIKSQPEEIIRVEDLHHHRHSINLPKPHSISDFLRKMPKFVELYEDRRGVLWCGMTEKAEELMKEGEEIIDRNGPKAAEFITKMLMMSGDKRLYLNKIAHFRRDLGLPIDFRKGWVHQYPELFKVVTPFWPHDEGEYLELVSWKSDWAITKLEETVLYKDGGVTDHVPGKLSLAFPLKFPVAYMMGYKMLEKIDDFQKTEYLSPYADAPGLVARSLEFDKRVVAVLHELLSFTIEKRLITKYLTHFRREYVMPQKLMRIFLKHFGIFYVSQGGKMYSVFLNEAYEGSELIEKHPLVVWKEKVLGHYVTRDEKRLADLRYEDFSDVDNDATLGCNSEGESSEMECEEDLMRHCAENVAATDESEMDIEDVTRAYNE